jgi:hypothetical protein
MKTIAIRCLTSSLLVIGCGHGGARGPSVMEGKAAVGASVETKPTPQGAASSAAGEAFKKMFDDLMGMIPEGWSFQVDESVQPPGDLWMKTIVFIYFKSDCTVHFGPNGQDTRKEYPNLTLFFYRIEDRQKLAAIEEPTRELSSHCPMDLQFAVTKDFFIARSPCNRAFAEDESCNPPVEMLEKALLEHFGKSP